MGEGWESGLFGFWLRFGSVTGFSNLFLRRSLAKNQKSSLRAGYSFSSNALILIILLILSDLQAKTLSAFPVPLRVSRYRFVLFWSWCLSQNLRNKMKP